MELLIRRANSYRAPAEIKMRINGRVKRNI